MPPQNIRKRSIKPAFALESKTVTDLTRLPQKNPLQCRTPSVLSCRMSDDPDPTPSDYVHPKTAEETGFFYPGGGPVPPTHPDHGPMDKLPRQEDGRFSNYYYCSKEEIAATADLPGPIVTEIEDAGPFYPAEESHQDFYEKNPVRYKSYRLGCRRDARLEERWGDAAGGE